MSYLIFWSSLKHDIHDIHESTFLLFTQSQLLPSCFRLSRQSLQVSILPCIYLCVCVFLTGCLIQRCIFATPVLFR